MKTARFGLFVLSLACVGAGGEASAEVSRVEAQGAKFKALRSQIERAAAGSSAYFIDSLEPARGSRLRPIAQGSTRSRELDLISVEVPAHAAGQIHLEDPTSGVAVALSVNGAAARPVAVAEGLLVYEDALGAGSHVALRRIDGGIEDFIVLPSAPSRPEITYSIDVSRAAGLRLIGRVLEVLDRGGAPRLRMGTPYLQGADGARRGATVHIEGCAYDTDPRGPWGRAITPPGAETCRIHVRFDPRGLAYPAVMDPPWTKTGSLVAPRSAHTATVLPSGKVLVAGGAAQGKPTAELFDPATGTWGVTGEMSKLRSEHVAASLGGGKVLVAGGTPGETPTKPSTTAEIYNEGTGTWSMAAGPLSPRSRATASELKDGRVLVVGGITSTNDTTYTLVTCEIYDPQSNTWQFTSELGTARQYHAATVLASGKVLVTGGLAIDAPGTSQIGAEIFDPQTGAWAAAAAMTYGRQQHTATTLPSGEVLVVGGGQSGAVKTCEIFDPVKGQWSLGPKTTIDHASHTASLLPSGLVLVASGSQLPPSSSPAAEVYKHATHTWSPAGELADVRYKQTASVLADGRVLIAGGIVNVGSAEIYEPSPIAAPCASGGECVAGYCVEGVCCDAACNSPCLSCLAAKKLSGGDGACGERSDTTGLECSGVGGGGGVGGANAGGGGGETCGFPLPPCNGGVGGGGGDGEPAPDEGGCGCRLADPPGAMDEALAWITWGGLIGLAARRRARPGPDRPRGPEASAPGPCLAPSTRAK